MAAKVTREALESLVALGKTTPEISKELKCSLMRVHAGFRRFGIKGVGIGEVARRRFQKERIEKWPLLEDEQWLRKAYLEDNHSVGEVAKLAVCSYFSALSALERFGIERRTPANTKVVRKTRSGPDPRFPRLHDEQWMRHKYVDENMTLEEIAKELGCVIGVVGKSLKHFGIPRRSCRTREGVIRSDRIRELQDKEWLEKEYLEKGRSALDIAKQFGCTVWHVQACLSRFRVLKKKSGEKVGNNTAGKTGTKFQDKKGYVKIFKPSHPFATSKGLVLEHRLVVEEAIGRYLTAEEEIHHVNEHTSQNHLLNLMLMKNHGDHSYFHHNPPAWIPCCPHCGKPHPESLTGRPDNVPLIYERPL